MLFRSDPDFNCAENLLVYGRYFGIPDAVLRERIPTLLEFAALSHKAQAKPGELSGGMKRRLSLARALINQPKLLLLDEPTTGLDPQARHLMWERLQQLLKQGTSILLTTHFMDEAERLCDRLLVLDHGRVLAEGRPRELIQQHLEPEVVEVYGPEALALRESPWREWAARVEHSGETVFFYTRDARPLLQALQQRGVQWVAPAVAAIEAATGDGGLQGKTFVLTGTLPTLSRDATKALIREITARELEASLGSQATAAYISQGRPLSTPEIENIVLATHDAPAL